MTSEAEKNARYCLLRDHRSKENVHAQVVRIDMGKHPRTMTVSICGVEVELIRPLYRWDHPLWSADKRYEFVRFEEVSHADGLKFLVPSKGK